MSSTKFIQTLEKIEYLHWLIERGATGSPGELAKKLQVAESSIYNYLDLLKSLGAKFYYDKNKYSYKYSGKTILNNLEFIQIES